MPTTVATKRRGEPHDERGLPAVHEPAQDVEAGSVGAQGVSVARRRVLALSRAACWLV